ncbi:hypothetical protein [Kitasatospora sp. CB02891]|nr:hypothetical protein [Kitasatospora sp. CB02891]
MFVTMRVAEMAAAAVVVVSGAAQAATVAPVAAGNLHADITACSWM